MDARRLSRVILASAAALSAAACAQQPRLSAVSHSTTINHTAADRECMARAMYFESNRTGRDGMLAVGTVVANRYESGRYGASVCDVVAQKGQFAHGVMTREMTGESAETARASADSVLTGQRHPGVKKALFFHTAGRRFHYPNMHYVLVAGGNAFYEKREAATAEARMENARSKALALAYARIDPAGAAKPIQVASLSPSEGPAVAPASGGRLVDRQPMVAQPNAYAQVAETPVVALPKVTHAPPRALAPAETPALASAAPVQTTKPAPTRLAEVQAPKRVLSPAGLTPVLASATPSPAAPVAPAFEPVASSPAPSGYVAAAFAAFN